MDIPPLTTSGAIGVLLSGLLAFGLMHAVGGDVVELWAAFGFFASVYAAFTDRYPKGLVLTAYFNTLEERGQPMGRIALFLIPLIVWPFPIAGVACGMTIFGERVTFSRSTSGRVLRVW